MAEGVALPPRAVLQPPRRRAAGGDAVALPRAVEGGAHKGRVAAVRAALLREQQRGGEVAVALRAVEEARELEEGRVPRGVDAVLVQVLEQRAARGVVGVGGAEAVRDLPDAGVLDEVRVRRDLLRGEENPGACAEIVEVERAALPEACRSALTGAAQPMQPQPPSPQQLTILRSTAAPTAGGRAGGRTEGRAWVGITATLLHAPLKLAGYLRTRFSDC